MPLPVESKNQPTSVNDPESTGRRFSRRLVLRAGLAVVGTLAVKQVGRFFNLAEDVQAYELKRQPGNLESIQIPPNPVEFTNSSGERESWKHFSMFGENGNNPNRTRGTVSIKKLIDEIWVDIGRFQVRDRLFKEAWVGDPAISQNPTNADIYIRGVRPIPQKNAALEFIEVEVDKKSRLRVVLKPDANSLDNSHDILFPETDFPLGKDEWSTYSGDDLVPFGDGYKLRISVINADNPADNGVRVYELDSNLLPKGPAIREIAPPTPEPTATSTKQPTATSTPETVQSQNCLRNPSIGKPSVKYNAKTGKTELSAKVIPAKGCNLDLGVAEASLRRNGEVGVSGLVFEGPIPPDPKKVSRRSLFRALNLTRDQKYTFEVSAEYPGVKIDPITKRKIPAILRSIREAIFTAR